MDLMDLCNAWRPTTDGALGMVSLDGLLAARRSVFARGWLFGAACQGPPYRSTSHALQFDDPAWRSKLFAQTETRGCKPAASSVTRLSGRGKACPTAAGFLSNLIIRRQSARKVFGLLGHPRKMRCFMSRCLTSVRKFLVAEEGPTAVEYAVMLALIIVVCLAAIGTIGTNAKTTFTKVGNSLRAGT
jgi:pilus assembly protein Flp/PilA